MLILGRFLGQDPWMALSLNATCRKQGPVHTGQTALQSSSLQAHTQGPSLHLHQGLLFQAQQGRPGGLLRPHPTILFPSDSPLTPRGPKGASSPLCMHSGSSWLPGSCGLMYSKSRDTPCKVGDGGDESSFQGEETSRKLRME